MENAVKRIFEENGFFGFSISSIYHNGNGKITVHFPNMNFLSQSPQYKPETNSLLHFTDLKALYSIINEGSLRLYNVNGSNDSNEFSYVATNLRPLLELQGMNDKDIESNFSKLKDYTFIFSATDPQNVQDIFMWETYGKGDTGVALEFEIQNNPADWKDFLLSKVQYGGKDDLNKVIEELFEIQKQNKNITFKLYPEPFVGLHKEGGRNWEKENEIRIILFNYKNTSFLERLRFNDFVNRQNAPFLKLPLYPNCEKIMLSDDSTRCFSQKVPNLKLNKIFLSPTFFVKGDKKGQFARKLANYAYMKMGYRFNNVYEVHPHQDKLNINKLAI